MNITAVIRCLACGLVVAYVLSACSNPANYSDMVTDGPSCFSNFDYSIAPSADPEADAEAASGVLGDPVRLPVALPGFVGTGETQTGIVDSAHPEIPSGFAVQLGGTDNGAAVLLFYSSIPRCEFGGDHGRTVTTTGRQVVLFSDAHWPEKYIDGVRGRLRSGKLFLEITLVWELAQSPPPAERLQDLLEMVQQIPS